MIEMLLNASGPSGSQALLISIAITALVLIWVLYRQVQVRPLQTSWIVPIVLFIVGIVTATQGSGGSSRMSATAIGILIALLVVDAAGLGAVRALTVRLWRQEGMVVRQGTWVTVALWLVGLGIHLGVDTLAHISDSTALLYVAVTLSAQRLVLQARAGNPARVADHPPGGRPAAQAASTGTS